MGVEVLIRLVCIVLTAIGVAGIWNVFKEVREFTEEYSPLRGLLLALSVFLLLELIVPWVLTPIFVALAFALIILSKKRC